MILLWLAYLLILCIPVKINTLRERRKKGEHAKSLFSLLSDVLEPGHMDQLLLS